MRGRGTISPGALILCVGLAVSGCGGGGEEVSERGVVEQVKAMFASVPRDSIVRLSDDDTLHLSASTRRFYRWRLHRSAWTDGERLQPRGKQLYDVIGRAHDDGLNPRSYGWDLARAMKQRLDSALLSDERRALLLGELDLVLTEGFSRYARDLMQGTLDPKHGGLDWRIPRDTTMEDVLKAVRAEPAAAVVARLRPTAPQYGKLMRALAHYRTVEAQGGWRQVPVPERRVGVGGATVVALRQRLSSGDDAAEMHLARYGEANADIFDDSLRAALARFQSRNAIDEDGELGANTLRELNHSVQERIADLRLNLDRWRWLPRDLGSRYIVVNVAGFELEMIEDGMPVVFMNVVVGKEGWNTPLFSDTIESLIVNPSWNIPESIAEAEVLPALRRDPSYLVKRHIDVLAGNRVVDASSVDLSKGKTYRFRQRPGPDNALGRLKFVLPNSDNIYLHDTPAGQLFSRTSRAFSHGCIRLEKPQELARALMERVTETPPDSLDGLIDSGRERTIRFSEGIPVYIVYFTAWADEDGTVRFMHDVYGRDEELEPERNRKLEHPLPAGRSSGVAGDTTR